MKWLRVMCKSEYFANIRQPARIQVRVNRLHCEIQLLRNWQADADAQRRTGAAELQLHEV